MEPGDIQAVRNHRDILRLDMEQSCQLALAHLRDRDLLHTRPGLAEQIPGIAIVQFIPVTRRGPCQVVMPEDHAQTVLACKIVQRSSQSEVLIQGTDVVRDDDVHICQGFLQSRREGLDQHLESGRDPTSIQVCLDLQHIGVPRIGEGQAKERNAGVDLLSARREDADLVSCIGHQARVLPQDAFHSPNDRRRRVMEKCNPRHRSFSRAA